jgi:hypothetical protein
MRQQIYSRASYLGTLSLAGLAGAALTLVGCSDTPPDSEDESQAATTDPSTTPISQLPFIEATVNQKLLGELLAKPTTLGETTALHVRLPAPLDSRLSESLVRIVGPVDSPQVLFRSDTLQQLGVISKSPGKDFFTAFATLAPSQLDILKRNQDQIASGAFGQATNQSVLFNGRAAVGRTINPTIDPSIFKPGGGGVPISGCAVRPTSTLQAWGQSLFITSPSVVQDPTRTWDPCTGLGTPGGVWTFAHLMTEMANGSGQTPSNFVKDWLSLWLNNYTVNGDVVPARTQMFNQVIQPWAASSGVTATLVTNPMTGVKSVTLSGPLNLNIAPFELEAIVNRIDLGDTVSGPSGYSGGTTSLPVTAGELRFIFDVVQPSGGSCGKKLFTTIFEYGVPGTGCASVVSWAQKWSALQAFPGFTAAYLAQLQTMTESVVLHGSAPTKGNQNAINQVRTNEIALGLPVGQPWELREFTLTDEQPAAGTNNPISGELRTHTVAQTTNDGAFSALGGDPTITSFVSSISVTPPVMIPTTCNASYTVPFTFAGLPFRAGNALIGPGHWNIAGLTTASPPALICSRFQFSLNTCHGCHHDDAGTNGLMGSTNFTHINATGPIPVTLSKFLTGGGPGLVFNVPDSQLGTPAWPFADLERRLQRLFDLSHCTSCVTVGTLNPHFIDQVRAIGPVPVDPGPDTRFPFQTGPITDIATVQKLLDMRKDFTAGSVSQTANFVRPVQSFAE